MQLCVTKGSVVFNLTSSSESDTMMLFRVAKGFRFEMSFPEVLGA